MSSGFTEKPTSYKVGTNIPPQVTSPYQHPYFRCFLWHRFFLFQTECLYVVQANLELLILLLQSSERWSYMYQQGRVLYILYGRKVIGLLSHGVSSLTAVWQTQL